MAIATPINSIYVPNSMCTVPGSFRNSLYRPQAMAQPSPNGKAMPARPTLTADLQLLMRNRISTSSPTRNRKRTSPRLAMRLRLGIEAVGKMASVKPGMRPMTDGPSRIPPMTSAITRGCRMRERGQCKRRQNMMIMPACESLSELKCLAGLAVGEILPG